MQKSYFVYILASDSGTLYIWVTNDLERRIYEHKNGLVEWFTKTYNCKKLVYFEETNDVHSSIEREKQLKKWNRAWKEKLIKDINPHWEDLAKDWNK